MQFMKENGIKVLERDTVSSHIPMDRGTKEDGMEIKGMVKEP